MNFELFYKNFTLRIEVLQKKFKDLDYEADSRLRAKISVLIYGGYISELKWADNVPWFGRIEHKGRSYFEMKENDETKSFKDWEKILYRIIRAQKNRQEYKMEEHEGDEIDYLVQRGFVTVYLIEI